MTIFYRLSLVMLWPLTFVSLDSLFLVIFQGDPLLPLLPLLELLQNGQGFVNSDQRAIMVHRLHTITIHFLLTARKVPHFWRLIISDLRFVVEVRRAAQEIGFGDYVRQFTRMLQTLPLEMSPVVFKIEGIKHRLPLNWIYFRDYVYRITSFVFNWTTIVLIISTVLECYLIC